MAIINTTDPKPGFVYDTDTDTWFPLLGLATQSLDGLTDVIITTPATNQVLAYNGNNWVNSSEAGDVSAVTAGTGITVTDSTGPIPSVAIDTTVTADLTTAQTLTNKTLTSPVLGGTTTTASGNLVVQPASYVLEVQGGGGGTDGAIQLNCYVNSHGQKIKSQPHSASATNTLLLPGGNTIGNSDSVLVSEIGTQTLTNKTLNSSILVSPKERMNIVASAATGTINMDTLTSGSWYYTAVSTGNWVLNVRGDGSTTLNSILTTGDSITVAFLAPQAATAYYNTALEIDGTTSGVTLEWQGGTAPAAGNVSGIDVYLYNIIKTASATYTVLASQTKFA